MSEPTAAEQLKAKFTERIEKAEALANELRSQLPPDLSHKLLQIEAHYLIALTIMGRTLKQ